MHPYINNFLNPYQENNLKMLLEVLRLHGARIAEEKVKEIERIQTVTPGYFTLMTGLKDSFFEDVISVGRIGDCHVSSSVTPSRNGLNRFNIDMSSHTGYHPPMDVVKYVKATVAWHYGTVVNLYESTTGAYSEHDALGYLFNYYGRELKNLFYYCDWKDFNFNAFYAKIEKFVNAAIESSANISRNTANSSLIVDFIFDYIKTGARHLSGTNNFKYGGVNIEVNFGKGVYQFIFNYKDIKSDQMKGLNSMLKLKEFHAKSVTFAPIKMLLVKEPKSFNGNIPVYK